MPDRRYLVLGAVVAVQALVIALIPSGASTPSSTVPTGRPATGGALSTSEAGGTSASGRLAGAGGGASSSNATGGFSAAATASPGGAPGGGPSRSQGANGSADTSHCVGGREFDPSVDYYAPPCTPGVPGASMTDNGGPTSQGVAPGSVTIVDYQTNYGTEVNTILQADGQYESLAAAQALDAAYERFINQHYVLWGRHLNIVTYQGKCQSVPPDYSCLLAEMDAIVNQYHPYAVYWTTTLCSACFARLAQDRTVAFGGNGFSDAFADANRPYIYSSEESSSRIETAFAQFWCRQLSSVRTARRVAFAERNNPAQSFDGQPRVLGVIAPNDPDNEDTVTGVLEPALRRDCGDQVSHTYFYAEDINTAAQQVSAGIAAMDTPANPATDVLCLCDPVAPAFFYEGEATHNYWPENVVADVTGMTADITAQSYMSGLGCPQEGQCEFDNAFGLSMFNPQPDQSQEPGAKVFRLGGGHGDLPVTGLFAQGVWEDYNSFASLVENTGPDLTPARMQAAAPTMGMRGGGGTGLAQVGFATGDYNWTQDVEVAYWDKNRTSPYNGQPGTFVPVEGARFNLNFPLESEPPIPANRP